jgi:hypothetical protein
MHGAEMKTILLTIGILFSAHASAHPPGLLDDVGMRCGLNQLTGNVKEVCLADVFTGEHSGGSERAGVLLVKLRDGRSKLYPVFRLTESSLYVFNGEVVLESYLKFAGHIQVNVQRKDDQITGLDSAGKLTFRVAY